MNWLLIALAVALVLAPLRWIMPSPRDRQLTRLREAARVAGLQVSVGGLPRSRRQETRQEDETSGACYRLLRVRKPRQALPTWRCHKLDPETEWPASAPDAGTVKQWFAGLPDSVVQLEHSDAGAALWWRETGDGTSVTAIRQLLETVQQAEEARHD